MCTSMSLHVPLMPLLRLDSYKHFHGTNKDAHAITSYIHSFESTTGRIPLLNPSATLLLSNHSPRSWLPNYSLLSCHLYGIGGVPAECLRHLTSHPSAWSRCMPWCCQRSHGQGSQAPHAPTWPSLPLSSLHGLSLWKTGWKPAHKSKY